MFNIGPFELVVLAAVALIVLGPDKLPGFIRDATRMLRTLREMATGARQQLREELGPEFADVDFRSLNPRVAITRAVFGDEVPDLQKYNPRNFDARSSAQNLLFGDDKPADATAGTGSANGSSVDGSTISMTKQAPAATERPRPRPRPRPADGFDSDAT